MTPRLNAYLELERAMLRLDDAGDPLADTLRDAMDPLWYGLSAQERSWLDARPMLHSFGEPLRVPLDADVLVSPPVVAPPVQVPVHPISDGSVAA